MSKFLDVINELVKKKQSQNPTAINPYDNYMQIATDIYNKGVENNNLNASNQAAIAGAQFKEINRNANELNKAIGKKDTGYENDLSIDAYNAYRNTVNQTYSQAEENNNSLYSYYLQNMQALQQAKDDKDLRDKEIAFKKEQFDYQKAQDKANADFQKEQFDYQKAQDEYLKIYGEGGVKDTIEEYLEGNVNSNGTIKSNSANKILDYVTALYGSEENIPNEVKAELNSIPGFTEWLNEYNASGGQNTNYEKANTDLVIGKAIKIDESGNRSENGKTLAVIDSASVGTSIQDNTGDNFSIRYDGNEYALETSRNKASSKKASIMDRYIKEAHGRDKQQGDVVLYGDTIYVVTEDGTYREVEKRESLFHGYDYNNLKKRMKYHLGIK